MVEVDVDIAVVDFVFDVAVVVFVDVAVVEVEHSPLAGFDDSSV